MSFCFKKSYLALNNFFNFMILEFEHFLKLFKTKITVNIKQYNEKKIINYNNNIKLNKETYIKSHLNTN